MDKNVGQPYAQICSRRGLRRYVRRCIPELFSSALLMYVSCFSASAGVVGNDANAYDIIAINGESLHLSPIWNNDLSSDQINNGDDSQSMTVSGRVIYMTDVSDGKGLSLWRFDALDGLRLENLQIVYPDNIPMPSGLINHVGSDQDGALFVCGEVRNSSNPVLDIDFVDSASGNVTSRLSVTLADLSSNAYNSVVKNCYFGHPEITGSVASGTFVVALPEVVTDEYPLPNVSRVWRLLYENGSLVKNYRMKLYGKKGTDDYDVSIPADENLRADLIDDTRMVVDNGLIVPGYYRKRTGSGPTYGWLRDGSVNKVDSKACGVDYFTYHGQTYLLFGSSVTNGAKFSVGHWTDFDPESLDVTLDGDAVSQMWEFPSTDGGLGSALGDKPVTLCSTIVESETGNDLVNLYVYSSGNALAHYVMANKLYPTGASVILPDNDFDWQMCDNVLHLSAELSVVVYSVDGILVYDGEASVLHDLDGLTPGVYVANIGQQQVKLIIK